MYSKHYKILVKRLVEENNKIREKQREWLIKGDLKMIDTAEIALAHNEETIRFIKRFDKEVEELEASQGVD